MDSEPKHKTWTRQDKETAEYQQFIRWLEQKNYPAILETILARQLSDPMRYRLWMDVLDVRLEDFLEPKERIAEAIDYVKGRAGVEEQIDKDVVRSFHWEKANEKTFDLPKAQGRLKMILSFVLSSDRSFHYFQGFNDLCSVLLRVLGLRAALLASVNLATRHFLPMLRGESLDQRIFDGLREFTKEVIRRSNPTLYATIANEAWRFPFLIKWILTWLSCYSIDATMIFDVMLLHPPIFICYLSASIINFLMPVKVTEEPCEVEAALSRQVDMLTTDKLHQIIIYALHLQSKSPPLLLLSQPQCRYLRNTLYGQLTEAPIPAPHSLPNGITWQTPTFILAAILAVILAHYLTKSDD